jgi:predicted permease
MTLLRGRLFTEFDDERAPGATVINEAMARAFWPGANPIGRHVKLSRSAASWSTVVGVVADARSESLKDAGVPEVYASAFQQTEKHLAIFLRGPFDVAAMVDRVREQVQLADDTLPVYDAKALGDTVSVALVERRFATAMVGLFAVTALLLATLGIYGVVSYDVNERTHEIGIRLALGAERRAIVRMVLRQGVALVLIGTMIGLACAVGVSRSMAGVLYGVRPLDPPTFAGVAGLLIAVAVIACYIPARRATRVDPMVALRNQ